VPHPKREEQARAEGEKNCAYRLGLSSLRCSAVSFSNFNSDDTSASLVSRSLFTTDIWTLFLVEDPQLMAEDVGEVEVRAGRVEAGAFAGSRSDTALTPGSAAVALKGAPDLALLWHCHTLKLLRRAHGFFLHER